MNSREFFDILCTKYPITAKYNDIKKYNTSQWQKAIKQFAEFNKLERMIRIEKIEKSKNKKKWQI